MGFECNIGNITNAERCIRMLYEPEGYRTRRTAK